MTKYCMVLLMSIGMLYPAMAQKGKDNYHRHETGIIKESDLLNGGWRQRQKQQEEMSSPVSLSTLSLDKEEPEPEPEPEPEREAFAEPQDHIEENPDDDPFGAPDPPDPPDLPVDSEVGFLFIAMSVFGLKALNKRG